MVLILAGASGVGHIRRSHEVRTAARMACKARQQVAAFAIRAMHTIQQARSSEAATLRWLHRFGYLTPAQIGQLVWPQSRSPASRLRMAQRVVARLAGRQVVIVHQGALCAASHVGLSLKGAIALRNEQGIDGAVSAKDLLRTISAHRDACNDTAIALMRDWSPVWTEREILTGQAPFRSFGGKVPDCAAFDPDYGVLWVEIENCRRGGRDLARLASWVAHWAFPTGADAAYLDSPSDRYWLFRVRFVLSAPEAAGFPGRLHRAMEAYGWSPFAALNRIEFLDMAGRVSVW